MSQHYNINWLIEQFDINQPLKFLFFYGHVNKLNQNVGEFCLSQWFELPFVVNNTTYKTAEHWMMAEKALLFNDQETYAQIIGAAKPGEAKKLGRQVKNFDETIWNNDRFEIVVQGNIHKFGQNPSYLKYLLNTSDRVLVEASPVDTIWGIGLPKTKKGINNPHNWRGLNLLGSALMEARDQLRQTLN